MKNQTVSSAKLPPLTSIKQQTFKLKELISIRTLFQTSEKGREYSKGTAAPAELWFRFLVPPLQSSQSFSRVLALSLALCASLTLNQACSANAFTTQKNIFYLIIFQPLEIRVWNCSHKEPSELTRMWKNSSSAYQRNILTVSRFWGRNDCTDLQEEAPRVL